MGTTDAPTVFYLLQARQTRVDQLSGECEKLEKQTHDLDIQLGRVQRESDQRGRIEQELTDRLQQLQRDFQEKTDTKGQSSEHLYQMKRQLMEVEQE